MEIAQTWLIAMRPMYLRGGSNNLLFYNGFGAIGIARDFKSLVRVAWAEICIVGYIDTGSCLLEKNEETIMLACYRQARKNMNSNLCDDKSYFSYFFRIP